MLVVGDIYLRPEWKDHRDGLYLSNITPRDDLLVESTNKILDAIKNRTKPQPRPQTGRQKVETPLGRLLRRLI